jgi:uncharacterized protein YjiK
MYATRNCRRLCHAVAVLLLAAAGGCAEPPSADAAAPGDSGAAPHASHPAAGDGAPADAGRRAEAAASSAIADVLAPERLRQWALPTRLREISGLALTDDQRLLALADERAEIHELDYREGKRVKRFGVGDPILVGDFEGIAATADAVFAITSTGVLVRFDEGGDRERVPFTRFVTGLEHRCEVEGLTWATALDALLIACKRVFDADGKGQVWLFRWSVAHERLEPAEPMVVAESLLADAIGDDSFHPSGISVDPTDGALWLVAARERAVARLGVRAGGRLELLDAARFPAADRHRQSEGIAVLANGSVLIGDEGGKNNKGKLSIYGEP